jgi:hypothetical protein
MASHRFYTIYQTKKMEASPLQDRFIETLAEHYAAEVENLVNTDATVSEVHRSVVRYVVEFDTTDCFIVIGWPSPYKIELREDPIDKSNNRYQFNDENYFSFTLNQYLTKPNMKYNKLHKFSSIIFDNILVNGKWAVTAYGLTEFLKSFDIPFVMYNSHQPIEIDQFNKNTIKNIDRQYYSSTVDKKETMNKIANHSERVWADKIITEIDRIAK